ncbi:MAG TPA: PEGA domain-containing protein [Myxococcota bacterium]|nr:PEGA domain-containing protein [Myxococcota bacterium]
MTTGARRAAATAAVATAAAVAVAGLLALAPNAALAKGKKGPGPGPGPGAGAAAPTPKELRPDIDDLPEAAGRVKLTAIFFDEDPVTGKTAVQLARSFRLRIKKDDRFAFYEISKLLEQGKLDAERSTIEKARSEFDRGKALYADSSLGKVGEAVSVLEGSLDAYRAVLGYVPRKEELIEALMYYASALYLSKKTADCEKVLREVVLLDPDLRYDDDRFPARMSLNVDKVREAVSAAPRGSVEIASDPPFAEVYVNGTYRGVTPMEVFGLPEGENYVTLRKDGYKKYADTMTVEADKSASFEASLEPVFRYPLYDETRKTVTPELGEPRAGKAVMETQSKFYVDQVVFVTLAAEGDELRATFYLYDLRSRLLLKKVTGLVDPKAGQEELDVSVGDMVTTLYTGVRLDGSIERPEESLAGVGERKKRPFFYKWWFWTGVGGVVLAGVLVPSVYLLRKSAGNPIDFCDACGEVRLDGL